jgi:hypothetical protein
MILASRLPATKPVGDRAEGTIFLIWKGIPVCGFCILAAVCVTSHFGATRHHRWGVCTR